MATGCPGRWSSGTSSRPRSRTGPRSGERVAVEPADPCGACGPCLAGHANLCVAVRFAGHGTTDGALRTVMAWPARLCLAAPRRHPGRRGRPARAARRGPPRLDLARIEAGRLGRRSTAAGRSACSWSSSSGWPARRRSSPPTGSTTGSPPPASSARRRAADADGPAPRRAGPPASIEVDVAFEVAGTDDALLDALTAVRPGGRVVVVGIPAEDRTSFAGRSRPAEGPVARRLPADGRARPRPGDRARRGRTGPDGAAHHRPVPARPGGGGVRGAGGPAWAQGDRQPHGSGR